MFEYFVAMLVFMTSTGDNGRKMTHRRLTYIPAHNRTDAEEMARALAELNSRHFKHGTQFERRFDVCVSVYAADDKRIYLPLHVVERIAEEYTAPKAA